MAEPPLKIPMRFFRTGSRREPVREWLAALGKDDRRAIGRDLMRVQYQWPIGMPLCRSMSANRIARVLFSFHEGTLIALHAFIKKTRKTPADDFDLARKRRREVEEGFE